MKKIVILSAFLTPFRSGAEACAEEVALALHDQFDITIVTAKMRSELPRKDMLQGKVPVIRVGIGHKIDKWLFPFLAPFAAKNLRPDIVHAVLESFAGMALVGCRFLMPRTKRILTTQSTNTSLFLEIIYRSANVITGISSVLIARAHEFGRLGAVLIPNGVHYGEIRAVCGKTAKVPGRMLFVGRLETMKGVDTLLKSIAETRITDYGIVSVHIVGDGSLRRELEDQTRSLGLSDRVTFLGRLDGQALLKEYAEAEIFCGLSRSEALGNVFLEAQAADCAVIATNVGGISDVVQHEKTGLLVQPDDVAAAARAIERVGKNDSLRAMLTRQGIENAAKYDWKGIAAQYATLYAQTVS